MAGLCAPLSMLHRHPRGCRRMTRGQRGSLDLAARDLYSLLFAGFDRRTDNVQLAIRLRETHSLCDEHGDVTTASLIETWIDEAEKRTWFLFEATRHS
jgi:hypothetical protein